MSILRRTLIRPHPKPPLPCLLLLLLATPSPARAQGAERGATPPVAPVSQARSLSTGRAIVRQGTTEFTLAPLQGAESVQAFYSYGNPNGSCANTGLETNVSSLLFLYEDR